MDAQTYDVWWRLHARVAKRETLGPQDREAYEAGLRQLDAEEEDALAPDEVVDRLRRLRERLTAADAEDRRLSEQYETVRTEIARMEGLLDERTRRALGIGGHA
jgi:hypothetical protein